MQYFLISHQTEVRLQVQSLVMTASDLCASAKPWDLQLQTVEVIYEEFYKQVGIRKNENMQG